MVWSHMPGWRTSWRVCRNGRRSDWQSCCLLRDLPSPGEWYLPSGVREPGYNLQSVVERLTTGNQPGQQPRGLTENQNLNQPEIIPGAVLHHQSPIPVSVLRGLTRSPDSVLLSPPPVPFSVGPYTTTEKGARPGAQPYYTSGKSLYAEKSDHAVPAFM